MNIRLQQFLLPYETTSASGSVVRSCDILAIENAEGLLQGLDLLLATCNTVFIALTSIHAGWLELFIVRKCGIQFLLGSIEVCLGFLESLFMVLLLTRLVLDVLGLLSLVHG